MDSDKTAISRDKIIKGIKVFSALTPSGIIIILYRSSFIESITHLRSFKFHFLAACIGLCVFDWIASGLRIYIFASRVLPDISLTGCIRASLVNIFMGGVTPSQTGGGPGQIYVLYKEGMTVTDATVVSFFGFLNTVVILPFFGILLHIFVKAETGSYTLGVFSQTSFFLFGLILLAVIFSLSSPDWFERFIRRLLCYIPVLGKRFESSNALNNLINAIKDYQSLFTRFIKNHQLVLITAFILTMLIYFSKFATVYVVLRGLGLEADFWQVMHMQILLILIFYFSPSSWYCGDSSLFTQG